MTSTRVGDLTLDELRQFLRDEFSSLIREAVHEALAEEIDENDFDDSTDFKPEVAAQLRHFMHERPRGKPVDDLVKELGLDG